MKAIIKPHRGRGLQIAEVPVPKLGAHDVLVQVKAASICGSDIPVYDWDDPWVRSTVQPGQIIGHEFCGVVAGCGEHVREVAVGDFVTAEGHLNCGKCSRCRNGEAHICSNLKLIGFDSPGAFAEYIAVPKSNIIRLKNLPLIIASVLDAFGNAVHATNKVPLTNNTVLVTGCGPIGLMVIALAKLSGARLILATDISEYRLNLAIKMGADFAIEPKEGDIRKLVRQKTGEDAGVDILFEMSGNASALKQGFRMLRSGGQAALLGLPKELVEFDFANDLIAKCVSVYGITGRVMFKTWDQAQKLLGSCQSSLISIITHRFLIDEFEKGIELMHSGKCGKVILFMDEESIQRSYTESPFGI